MKLLAATEKVFDDVFDKAFFEYTKNRFFSDDELTEFKSCFYEAMRNYTKGQLFDENKELVNIILTTANE